MWYRAIWKGHPMRLELTRVGLPVELANHYTTRGAFRVCNCLCGVSSASVTRNNIDNTNTNWTTITKKQKWEEKQLYGRFKRLISDISLEKTWMWLRKGNLKRETESFLIAVQNKILKFSGPSLLGTASSTPSIHSNGHPAPFSVWGFIMTFDDCHILSTRT